MVALLPFAVFAAFYVSLGVLAGDFYRVPMTVAFLVAIASALCLDRSRPVGTRIESLAKGMGETDIMLMCLIFVLAGAFAAVAKGSGAVDAAVTLARAVIPDGMMAAGLFVVSAVISLAVGSGCGTIAAVTPIALAFAGPLAVPPALLAGAVVSGAMFGDNLSMISDTTIAATRTQGVEMRDKFVANAALALPAALVAFLLYFIAGSVAAAPSVGAAAGAPAGTVTLRHVVLVAPYVLVLVLALAGLNVAVLLMAGTALAAALGVAAGSFDGWGALELAGKGTLGMSETLTVALLAGGLFRLVREAGGVAWLTNAVARAVRGPRTCEAGAFLLTALVNLFTANNTVAIVIAGPVVRELGAKFRASPVRLAGLIDVASCVVQGLIPYGAQILIATGVARGMGMDFGGTGLVGRVYYPALLALAACGGILAGGRRNASEGSRF